MTTDLVRQTDEQRSIAPLDREAAAGALAHILATGDLSKLSNEQRVAHYLNQCDSLGLNPISRPFDWLILDGKLVLYPNKSCAEQLRRHHQISVRVTRSEPTGATTEEPMFVVVVEGTTPGGRQDTATKYVSLMGFNKQGQKYRLSGQNLANAYAKAETGAKRRLVLSMVGLSSPPDPDEAKSAKFVTVDAFGRVLDAPSEEQRYLAENPRAARAIGEPTFETVATASRGPLAGHASQAARPDELVQPKREGPRPSFRASDEDVKRWCGAWFAVVDETPWDGKEQRAEYVANWTATVAEWPEAKRTDSLRTMFARCTSDEAGYFLAQARAMVAAWRQGVRDGDEITTADAEDVAALAQGELTHHAREELAADAARPMADLSDEEIEERFEQGTERLMGRPRAEEQGPTRTELLTELRAMIAEVQARGGAADVPDDLTSLTDAEIEALTNGLAESLKLAF